MSTHSLIFLASPALVTVATAMPMAILAALYVLNRVNGCWIVLQDRITLPTG